MSAQEGILKIEKLQERDGFLPKLYAYPNRYNAGNITSNSYSAINLLIHGTIEGVGSVVFFTPVTVIRKVEGFLNYRSIVQGDTWFKQTNEETKTHKGHPMFDGGKTPNIAIETTSEINPTFKVGDVIKISYKVKKQEENRQILNYVKLKEIIKA